MSQTNINTNNVQNQNQNQTREGVDGAKEAPVAEAMGITVTITETK